MGTLRISQKPSSSELLQGLDVVLFSVAKAEWSKSRDKFERETGQVVTKETFLQVFGEAYLAAFTPANNQKACNRALITCHPPAQSPVTRAISAARLSRRRR